MYNIEKMVKRTFEILQCFQCNIFKSMFNHFFYLMYEVNFFEHKRSNDFYITLQKAVSKKFWQVFRSKKMEGNKRVKVLLKVIQRICDKNTGMQEVIDASITEVCTKEGVSPEQVFFYFAFSLLLSLSQWLFQKNQNKTAEDIKNSLWKF